ncbi:MAG: flagellar biosynthesis anti-sigma factor FlgM [Deltaproteobacteria bacterium]|nr:flagellar biosynthesis anti-sigma factor FlgM [Deltaproteobacteria bacterium]MBW2019787.1 flagellar biosynthesis anti-sigma factor FlgM [Deltaproteobacteria bacterium]MBW2074667.1 flagellar biosynthesis anti-sigma factor FlgM [Deltaproteobacteria bacterium]RLB83485.1 MAG: flagellar biosynthesis anti-sigma factor FlgM [Deltaproteobacteria bacterium]
MKITDNGYEIAGFINKTTPSPGKEQAEKASTPLHSPPDSKGDAIVDLSETSKEVQRAKEVIESEPDIRSEKVDAIKDEVDKGAYKIDYDQTAEKMVGVFIDEFAG